MPHLLSGLAFTVAQVPRNEVLVRQAGNHAPYLALLPVFDAVLACSCLLPRFRRWLRIFTALVPDFAATVVKVLGYLSLISQPLSHIAASVFGRIPGFVSLIRRRTSAICRRTCKVGTARRGPAIRGFDAHLYSISLSVLAKL
jgi:hypothetical protein